jgi:hypothetical protein
VVAFNLISYLILIILWSNESKNQIISTSSTTNTNSSRILTNVTSNTSSTSLKLLVSFDLFNCSIIPFIVMFVFSIALIVFIRKSRHRINTSAKMYTERFRDRKFAFTSLTLNLVFLAFTLPVLVSDWLATYSELGEEEVSYLGAVSNVLFYTFYAIDFYIQLTVNSLFREQFGLIFLARFKKLKTTAKSKLNVTITVTEL